MSEITETLPLETTRHESVLVYKRFRYLRWAVAVCLIAAIAYVVHQPDPAPNGGTWLGYTLGTIAALIIVFLTWFGIRKRRYDTNTRLADWLSAHVYLGLSLIVLATLHTGFQMGWNVHTLAYVLMLLVILSGVYGIYAYLRYPRLMTENRRGVALQQMLAQIADLDRELRRLGMPMREEVNRALLRAANDTTVGGSFWRQLRGRDPQCATSAAREVVTRLIGGGKDEATMRQLLAMLARKEGMLSRARRDVQLAALLKVWLFVHVPLTVALLAALLIHILSVFMYW